MIFNDLNQWICSILCMIRGRTIILGAAMTTRDVTRFHAYHYGQIRLKKMVGSRFFCGKPDPFNLHLDAHLDLLITIA